MQYERVGSTESVWKGETAADDVKVRMGAVGFKSLKLRKWKRIEHRNLHRI